MWGVKMSFQWNQDSLIMIKVQILQHAHVGIFPSQNLLTLFCLFIGHKNPRKNWQYIPIFFPLDICELPVLFEGYDLKIRFSSLTTLTLFTKSTFLNQNANCKICFNCHKMPKTTKLISQNFWTTTVATIALLQIPPQTAKIIWMDTYLSKMVWNIITVPSFPFINLHIVDRITFLIIAEDKIPNSRIFKNLSFDKFTFAK